MAEYYIPLFLNEVHPYLIGDRHNLTITNTMLNATNVTTNILI